VGQSHWKRGVVSLRTILSEVAHEQAVEAGGIEHRGEARVVAGEHRNLRGIVAQLLQGFDGQSRHPILPS
jgi:hypothetical protein